MNEEKCTTLSTRWNCSTIVCRRHSRQFIRLNSVLSSSQTGQYRVLTLDNNKDDKRPQELLVTSSIQAGRDNKWAKENWIFNAFSLGKHLSVSRLKCLKDARFHSHYYYLQCKQTIGLTKLGYWDQYNFLLFFRSEEDKSSVHYILNFSLYVEIIHNKENIFGGDFISGPCLLVLYRVVSSKPLATESRISYTYLPLESHRRRTTPEPTDNWQTIWTNVRTATCTRGEWPKTSPRHAISN